jgi:hypothetical protein
MRAYRFLNEKFGLISLREKRLKISLLDDLNDPFELLPYEMTDPNRRIALRRTVTNWPENMDYCASALIGTIL